MAKVNKEVKVGGKTYTRKAVTMPQLKFEDGKTLFVEIVSEIRTSTATAAQKGKDGKDMKPADVCNVINLDNGEEATIIVGTVLRNRLEETYPKKGDKWGYVGRRFELTQHKVSGKRWKDYSIAELE